jgi:small subunit ribosomal protein S23
MKAVESAPPTEILTRPYALQHATPNPKAKKPSKLYRPTRIVFPEDELRRTFYRDHPWELARPRIFAETDGLDARYRDWSKGLRQIGMPLTGERLVLLNVDLGLEALRD